MPETDKERKKGDATQGPVGEIVLEFSDWENRVDVKEDPQQNTTKTERSRGDPPKKDSGREEIKARARRKLWTVMFPAAR